MISIGNLQINKLCLGNLEVVKAYLGDVEVYCSTPQPVEKYMTMTVLDGIEGTTIAPTFKGTLSTKPNLQYRVNGGDWNEFILGTTSAIHVVYGDVVQFKGTNESGISTSQNNYMNFAISGNPVALSGNVMSLIDGVGDVLVIPNNYCFYKMFSKSNVKTVSSDFLPAMELKPFCYADLFSECILLENAPELPALTMQENCYRGMFYGCQKLTQAPTLPSKKLAPYCYQGLFQKCTSLVNPPEILPAEVLKDHCYYFMFSECKALTTSPEISAMVLERYCCASMFSGCQELTTAPVLKSQNLVESCYDNLFDGCTKINYIKSFAVSITIDDTSNWLRNVSPTGTFEKPAEAVYSMNNTSGIPKGWSVQEIDVPTPGPTPPTPEPEGKYMTIKVLDGYTGSATISPQITGTLSHTTNLQYRINNGSWNDFIVDTTDDIRVDAGNFVQLKGLNPDGISDSDENYLNFIIYGNPVSLSGNLMSLIDGVGDSLVIPSSGCFYRLFFNSNVKTISSDFLPATELKNACYADLFSECFLLENSPELPALKVYDESYRGMFYGCKKLTQAPALPATELAPYCYQGLFQKCTSLVNPPETLPAEVLKDHCYYYMFSGTAITTTPEIKATVLAQHCCTYMFEKCKSLKSCNPLPSTGLAPYCYSLMFSNCSSITVPPELKATVLASYCYSSMFSGCQKLTQAPSLPATVLEEGCYNSMFSGCTSLTAPPSLPATVLVPYCYKNMFNRCSKLAKSPSLNSTDLAQGCYDSMFYQCTALKTPPALPATVIKDSCYYQMFYGCTSLETSPSLPGENLENHCYERMFKDCLKLTQAPVLNCTTLVDNCYKEMFSGCTALNYIKSMATEGTIKSDGTVPLALQNWLKGVSSTGTFEKPAAAVYVTDSPGGIPQGWTVVNIDEPTQEKYMTMTVLDGENGTTITPTVNGSLPNLNLQYRVNNGEWSDFIVGTTAAIKVVAGDVVQWKGNNPDGISTSYPNYLNFGISGNPVALSGNIMSLIDGVGDALVVPSAYCFCSLFYNSSIKTVSSDFLPATTLADNCYRELFSNCQILTQAPALPATTLEGYCYTEMFRYCYELKQAPELPAKVLVDGCYKYMFQDSSSLNYVKCLATDNISTSTISSWLSGVSSTGTFEKPTIASYLKNSGSGIPSGWTVVNL